MKFRLAVKIFIVGVFQNNPKQGQNNGKMINHIKRKNPGENFYKNKYLFTVSKIPIASPQLKRSRSLFENSLRKTF